MPPMHQTFGAEQAITETPPGAVRIDWGALGLGVVIFLALSIYFGVRSEGFLEGDACTHYLFARWSINEPHYFVSVWGRPLCTGLYALPAWLFGRIGVQITSGLIAVAIALLTTLVARGQGFRRPELAGIFVLAQPLVFLHSFSELTELPFALLVAGALLAYQRRQWLILAILCGLMPLGRPEGFGFVLLAGVGLLLHRRWWWMPVLVLPLVIWNYAGWYLTGRTGEASRWLINSWPYSEKSMYAAGHLLHFVGLLPMLIGPLVFPALFVGIWRGIASCLLPVASEGQQPRWQLITGLGRCFSSHHARVQLLIVAIPLGVLAVHSLLYWLGRMASNGELRYLIVAAPMWGLLVAMGWEWTFDRLRWKYAVTAAGVAAILPLGANLFWTVLPLGNAADWQTAEALARWYGHSEYARSHPHLMTSHIALYYYADVSKSDPQRARDWSQQMVRRRPPGTILIWDPVYGLYNSDANLSVTTRLIEQAGWKEIPWPFDWLPERRSWSPQSPLNSPEPGDTWRIYISE